MDSLLISYERLWQVHNSEGGNNACVSSPWGVSYIAPASRAHTRYCAWREAVPLILSSGRFMGSLPGSRTTLDFGVDLAVQCI